MFINYFINPSSSRAKSTYDIDVEFIPQEIMVTASKIKSYSFSYIASITKH
jgi:hypothetical protein